MTMNINGIQPTGSSNLKAKNESAAQVQDSGNNAVRNQAEDVTTKTAGEQVSLSNQVQGLKQLENSIRSLPEVDESRVARIKAALADGTYQIDNEKLAGKLLSFEEETN